MSKPGTTNNPSGRPKSVGVVAQLRREMLTGGKLEDLVEKVYGLAIQGDLVAARLILDRAWPALRSQAALVNVPLNPADTLTAKATALLQAAADGELPSCAASELIRALASICQITEADELKKRLDALEYGDLA